MFRVTTDLKIKKAGTYELEIELENREYPIKLDVQPYEDGVVIHVPWYCKEELGNEDGYAALKLVLRSHYAGRIGFRTATDPRFLRSASARGENRAIGSNRTKGLLTHVK